MKKVVLLLIALSVFCVAKPAKKQPKANAKKAETEVVVKDETPAVEENAAAPEESAEATPEDPDELLEDSALTFYIHPFNFMVPYSHFWAGVNVPEGFTDYPLYYLTVEWKLMPKISLMTSPHYVRVARKRKHDRYKIHDIGLQESFRLYGVGGKRWRYFQAGLVVDHLHIHSNRDGSFDGWLYGFMLNGGVKKVLNGGEGFLGHFAVFLDAGLGYMWTSDFDAERKGKFFEMEKGLVIDINAAIGFRI